MTTTPSQTFDERRWTSRDGLSLYARDYSAVGGESRLPVICLHGLTRNSKDFEEVAPRLAALGRRVVVPDVRGRGQSQRDPHPAHYKPPTYARDVAEMMAALGMSRAVFLGTSMGGIITMTLAALRLKAIAAAILNDVGPAIAPAGLARILGYAGKPIAIDDWADAADYVRRTNAAALPGLSDDDWKRLARRTFTDGPAGPVLDYDLAIAASLNKAPGAASLWIARLMFRRLANKRPTLLVRGAQSDIVTPDIAENMQRMAPRLQRVDVPGVGHAPTLSEPAAVDAVDRFLRTVA